MKHGTLGEDEMNLKERAYHRKYSADRYKNEPEYRKRLIGYVSAWQKAHRPRLNRQQRERYVNRTPAEIKKRKLYLVKLRIKQKRRKK